MHRTLNILDADQSLYSGLVDAQTADLARYLKLNAGLARVDLDPDFAIPHIDADARLRAARNDLAAGLDHLLTNASQVAGAVAAIVGLGAAMQVVALYVGGVL
ncbi:hypothetical protein [Methylobacterium aquaticum]|uniref:Uncharacterized protein n=1 Tax=Methylobacterium aquaticum TaxID=270351 RepID=A0A0J6S520_9HYPH|nr:hypothetical protein [Methylobacterium aquaticum]KMO28543.1 hypothetical protein VP06_27090 [Methylobacterium aquaticum]